MNKDFGVWTYQDCAAEAPAVRLHQAMKVLLILGPMLLMVSGDCLAQVSGCSQAQGTAAEQSVDHLRSWADLHRAFRSFAACDNGAIAEGWDDFVARTLARRWDRFEDLQRIAAKDKPFRAFVLRHISVTAAAEDLDRALRNAREHCPKDGKALCADIANAIAASRAE